MEIHTIEAHTGGEPLRVILSGYPSLDASSILKMRKELLLEHDYLRRVLMWEPRGHSDMYGALLVKPELPTSDIGVIFMHNNGYSTGCGHAIICLLYTSDAADDLLCVDLGGRRIIKKNRGF